MTEKLNIAPLSNRFDRIRRRRAMTHGGDGNLIQPFSLSVLQSFPSR
jgi:hypothetical protein